MNEEKIKGYMKKYGITREEAVALIEDDMAVDKMTVKQTMADLTPEQKKARKEMTITTSEKKRGERKVERKPNEAKRNFIAILAEAMKDYNPTVSNIEKQIDFSSGGVEYSITLTAHRPPKK